MLNSFGGTVGNLPDTDSLANTFESYDYAGSLSASNTLMLYHVLALKEILGLLIYYSQRVFSNVNAGWKRVSAIAR